MHPGEGEGAGAALLGARGAHGPRRSDAALCGALGESRAVGGRPRDRRVLNDFHRFSSFFFSFIVFSRMRSEGFLFLSGGSGGGTVFVPISGLRPRTFVLCPMRCALRIGLEGGRLGGALWRCAVVIAGESPVWVAPSRCDWWGEPGLGGRAWSGRRCAVVIAGEGLSCHIVSCRVVSCHVLSCPVGS